MDRQPLSPAQRGAPVTYTPGRRLPIPLHAQRTIPYIAEPPVSVQIKTLTHVHIAGRFWPAGVTLAVAPHTAAALSSTTPPKVAILPDSPEPPASAPEAPAEKEAPTPEPAPQPVAVRAAKLPAPRKAPKPPKAKASRRGKAGAGTEPTPEA